MKKNLVPYNTCAVFHYYQVQKEYVLTVNAEILPVMCMCYISFSPNTKRVCTVHVTVEI